MQPQLAEKPETSAAKAERRAWIALAVLCVIGAAAAGRRIAAIAWPSSTPSALGLDEHFLAESRMVLLHVVPSLLFIALVPFQFMMPLRRRRPRLHRWMGRVTMALGVVLGVSALYLSAHPVGGLSEGTATVFYGCFFLFAIGKAWRHIRRREIVPHREWVTRMTAIAAGVATTRPIMAVFFATSRSTGLTPAEFFGPAMWLGLTSTYLAGEAWIQHTRSRNLHYRANSDRLSVQ